MEQPRPGANADGRRAPSSSAIRSVFIVTTVLVFAGTTGVVLGLTDGPRWIAAVGAGLLVAALVGAALWARRFAATAENAHLTPSPPVPALVVLIFGGMAAVVLLVLQAAVLSATVGLLAVISSVVLWRRAAGS